jgi:hypothetical protein
VLVVQFRSSITLRVFLPSASSSPIFHSAGAPRKYVHAELGFAVVLGLDHGVLKGKAQLTLYSLILHPIGQPQLAAAHYKTCSWSRGRLGHVSQYLAFAALAGFLNPPRHEINW